MKVADHLYRILNLFNKIDEPPGATEILGERNPFSYSNGSYTPQFMNRIAARRNKERMAKASRRINRK